MLQNWFAFSTDDNSETLECSAINNGRSILSMLLTVLYELEIYETETLKQDLLQLRSDSSESATVDFHRCHRQVEQQPSQLYDRTCEWASQ